MAAALILLVVFVGLILPLAHVILSPRGGPWLTPPGSRCPLGPRLGWVVIVLFLGPIGWLLYMRARRRHAPGGGGAGVRI